MGNLFTKLKETILNEPVLLTALFADAVVWLGSELNIVVTDVSAKAYLAPLVIGLIQRIQVTPTRKV